jgi:hypothetical protein
MNQLTYSQRLIILSALAREIGGTKSDDNRLAAYEAAVAVMADPDSRVRESLRRFLLDVLPLYSSK